MCPDPKKKKRKEKKMQGGRDPETRSKLKQLPGLARQREGEGRSLGAEKVDGESLAE